MKLNNSSLFLASEQPNCLGKNSHLLISRIAAGEKLDTTEEGVIMFMLDYVFNQKNWTPWQSNWLRHQIVKSGYQTTLKVLVVKLETSSHRDL